MLGFVTSMMYNKPLPDTGGLLDGTARAHVLKVLCFKVGDAQGTAAIGHIAPTRCGAVKGHQTGHIYL